MQNPVRKYTLEQSRLTGGRAFSFIKRLYSATRQFWSLGRELGTVTAHETDAAGPWAQRDDSAFNFQT